MTELTDACNFADDKTFHACDSSLEDSVNRLEYDANLVIEWFDCNYMKLIKDKCHVSISGHKSDTILNQIMQDIFEKRQNIDYNLRFQINFVLPGVNTTYFSLHSLRYFSSKIWTVISDEIKNSANRIYQPHRSRRGGVGGGGRGSVCLPQSSLTICPFLRRVVPFKKRLSHMPIWHIAMVTLSG